MDLYRYRFRRGSSLQPENMRAVCITSRSKVGVEASSPLKRSDLNAAFPRGGCDFNSRVFLFHLSHFLQAFPRDGSRRKTPIEVCNMQYYAAAGVWMCIVPGMGKLSVGSLKKRLRSLFLSTGCIIYESYINR